MIFETGNELSGTKNQRLLFSATALKRFTVIFTLECVAKVIAFGLGPFGCNTYLSDPWNQLDFVVVVTALLEVLPGMPSLTGLRTFRLGF